MDNSQPMRYAIYARYSSDLQRQSSIEDQIRKCDEFGQAQGWVAAKDCIYTDEAISGVSTQRPGLQRMLAIAIAANPPFDVILVDDTSRISRNLSDAVQLFEKLRFAGLRVIAVAQGIDTRSEQADVLVTVHGLVDSLYVKELAKKTHRGLEGAVLRGLHAGGRCFGYRSVPLDGGGVRLEIEGNEAAVVRRIFEMSANGMSLKAIAKALNGEKICPPRPRAMTRHATWAPTVGTTCALIGCLFAEMDFCFSYRSRLQCYHPLAPAHPHTSIQALFDRHLCPSHATADVGTADLIRCRLPAHGVVLGHGASFHSTQYGIQIHLRIEHPVRISGVPWLADESLIPRRQVDLLQNVLASSSVRARTLRNPFTSRSWAVPKKRSIRPLACGE
jgi:DNA invertase Pin-like site-specific DNA recombinase